MLREPVCKSPSTLVTDTVTAPKDPLGTTQSKLVAVKEETDVQAEPPKLTVTPFETSKPVPFTVTVLVPAVGPPFGLIDVTVGAT